MGLYRNVQPHECQLSEVAVKEQASLLVQKKTTEIGRKEMRGQNVKVRPISGWRGVWKMESNRSEREDGGEEHLDMHDVMLLQGLNFSFLNHHLLLFKNILSFNA